MSGLKLNHLHVYLTLLQYLLIYEMICDHLFSVEYDWERCTFLKTQLRTMSADQRNNILYLIIKRLWPIFLITLSSVCCTFLPISSIQPILLYSLWDSKNCLSISILIIYNAFMCAISKRSPNSFTKYSCLFLFISVVLAACFRKVLHSSYNDSSFLILVYSCLTGMWTFYQNTTISWITSFPLSCRLNFTLCIKKKYS
jgi:hypothetical protein